MVLQYRLFLLAPSAMLAFVEWIHLISAVLLIDNKDNAIISILEITRAIRYYAHDVIMLSQSQAIQLWLSTGG